jgi:seryl-tRNA synthetase
MIMAEVEKSKQKIYNFKEEVPNVKKKMWEYDLAISKHEEAIRELRSKKESLLKKDEKLKKEANLLIKKIEESKRQNAEIAKSVDEGKLLDIKLAHSKKNLDKLITEFKINICNLVIFLNSIFLIQHFEFLTVF